MTDFDPPSKRKRRPTLKDVANVVGVHVSTVSRALDARTRHLITPELAQRVIEVSRQLDYRRNAAAHSLRTQKSRLVGIVVPDITSAVFPPMIRGLEDVLSSQGYLTVIAHTDGRAAQEATIIELLRARGVDGLVVASAEHSNPLISQLAASGVPVVAAIRRLEDPIVSSVVVDEIEGIRQVARHLIGLGHKKIAMIAGPQAHSTGKNRLETFQATLAEAGLTYDPRLMVAANEYNEHEGERCAEALLDRNVELTAIMAGSDRLAVGAIDALKRRNMSCPGDVSVTGFNDIPLADRLNPPLTTVRIQPYRIGTAAGNILADRLSDVMRDPRHLVLPVEMVVRGSSAPPRT